MSVIERLREARRLLCEEYFLGRRPAMPRWNRIWDFPEVKIAYRAVPCEFEVQFASELGLGTHRYTTAEELMQVLAHRAPHVYWEVRSNLMGMGLIVSDIPEPSGTQQRELNFTPNENTPESRDINNPDGSLERGPHSVHYRDAALNSAVRVGNTIRAFMGSSALNDRVARSAQQSGLAQAAALAAGFELNYAELSQRSVQEAVNMIEGMSTSRLQSVPSDPEDSPARQAAVEDFCRRDMKYPERPIPIPSDPNRNDW